MAGPQGGRTADYGSGEGGVAEEATRLVTPSAITTTGGGDPATGSPLDPPLTMAKTKASALGRCRRRSCQRRTPLRMIAPAS